jgi:hypothetical protein
MIIYRDINCFYFTNDKGVRQNFSTLEEALEAGGTVEKVSVSGVPYKVTSTDLYITK